MSDVEKYGLFAVVLVGGLLLIIAVSGGFSDEEPPAQELVAAAGAPIVLDQPAPLRGPDGATRDLTAVHVAPLLPTDKPFSWSEPPVAYPGERSVQPAPATVMTPAATESAGTYVIREGDTLADIAARELGSSKKWEELVKLNPGLDAKRLKIGQTIRLGGSAPAALASAPPTTTADKPVTLAAKPERTHKVSSGDTLGGIAKKYLGSTKRANDIYEANKDVLKNPDALKIGQVLRIP